MPHVQRVIYTEMVRVLVYLPERYTEAANLAARAVFLSKVFDDLKKDVEAIDKEAWRKFLSKFPRT